MKVCKFKAYPIGYFHIDIAEVRTAAGASHLPARSPFRSDVQKFQPVRLEMHA